MTQAAITQMADRNGLALDEDFAQVVAGEVHLDAGEIAEDAFDEGVGEELVKGCGDRAPGC